MASKGTVERVEIRSVNSPTYRSTVEKPKYDAMKRALFKVLPSKGPGLTQNEMFAKVKPHLPAALFPGGAKAEWWVKCVQLDQEARGAIVRDASARPLRWRKA